jgi:hypothetical protein
MADTLSLLLSFSCGNYSPLPLHPGCLFVPPNSLGNVYMLLGSFFYLHVIVYASFSFSTHLLHPSLYLFAYTVHAFSPSHPFALTKTRHSSHTSCIVFPTFIRRVINKCSKNGQW